MIYIFEHTQTLNEKFLEQTFSLLSVQRQEKIKKYNILSDKINGCIGFLLLKYALRNEFDIDDKPEFIFGEREKPFLKNYPDIFFSISHCKNAVVCAVSDKNIAVDIMDYRKPKPSVIKRVCSPDEQNLLMSSSNIDKDFTRLWVMKECYSKLDGHGLSLDFSKITDELEECKNIKYIQTEDYILGYTKIKNDKMIKLSSDILHNFSRYSATLSS